MKGKKQEMKNVVKKSKFVILPALATLVLTGVASVTGTVAWFTANREVSATGMKFKTSAENNLFIRGDKANSKETWETQYKFTTPTDGILQPVSTVDGMNFYKTDSSNAKEDGKKEDAANYVAIVGTNGKYDSEESSKSYAYLDYAFQLKAVNTTTTNVNVKITKINLLFDDKATGVKAFRTATFVKENTTTEKPAAALTVNDATLKSISRMSGATYQDGTKAVGKANESNKIGLQTISTSKIDQELVIGSAAAKTSSYFQVIVRVWLEGEDTDCTNTVFADKNASDWSVDLKVSLDGNAATNITSEAPTSNSQGN